MSRTSFTSVVSPLLSRRCQVPRSQPRAFPSPTAITVAAVGRRSFVLTRVQSAADGKDEATSGWKGRSTDEHAVKRDGNDVQSKESQQGMKDHEELKEGSQAISRKDEGNNNKRAKEDHPEAPEPVIGMNEERGSKGH